MSKKVPIDRLADEIEKILKEYNENLQEDIDQVAKKFAQKGANTVKQNARVFKPTRSKKRYANGWTSKTTKPNRLRVESVIYNGTVPGLTQLLENGHALRQGGRAHGVKHIAPVEEKIVMEFEREVKSKI